MMAIHAKKVFVLLIITLGLMGALTTSAQTKTRKKTKRTPENKQVVTEIDRSVSAEAVFEEKRPQKKNQRNDTVASSMQEVSDIQKKTENRTGLECYKYEFEGDQFIIKRIRIEHDETGEGTLTFWKKDLDEEVTEPLKLSANALRKIKSLFQSLSFLDSSEDYQSKVHDYKHLGTATISLKVGEEKSRTVSFNWTKNKDARALADEYRKIANQKIWIFEMNLARENQPLEAPSLMSKLELYVKQGSISDPEELLLYLSELANDERLPLIARNHATRLIEQIKKKEQKE